MHFCYEASSTHYPLLIPSQVSGIGTHPLSSLSTVQLRLAAFPYATQSSCVTNVSSAYKQLASPNLDVVPFQ